MAVHFCKQDAANQCLECLPITRNSFMSPHFPPGREHAWVLKFVRQKATEDPHHETGYGVTSYGGGRREDVVLGVWLTITWNSFLHPRQRRHMRAEVCQTGSYRRSPPPDGLRPNQLWRWLEEGLSITWNCFLPPPPPTPSFPPLPPPPLSRKKRLLSAEVC